MTVTGTGTGTAKYSHLPTHSVGSVFVHMHRIAAILGPRTIYASRRFRMCAPLPVYSYGPGAAVQAVHAVRCRTCDCVIAPVSPDIFRAVDGFGSVVPNCIGRLTIATRTLQMETKLQALTVPRRWYRGQHPVQLA